MMAMIETAAISVGCEIWKKKVEIAGGSVCASDPAARNCEKANSFQQTMKQMAVVTAIPGHDIGRITR